MVTHTLSLSNIHSKRIFNSFPNKHLGWNFGVSNVGRSQQPFFRTFWFGSSEEACVDVDASLNKASKFADILSESYSNMIGLLIHVLCKSNGDLLVIGSM